MNFYYTRATIEFLCLQFHLVLESHESTERAANCFKGRFLAVSALKWTLCLNKGTDQKNFWPQRSQILFLVIFSHKKYKSDCKLARKMQISFIRYLFAFLRLLCRHKGSDQKIFDAERCEMMPCVIFSHKNG